MSRYALSVGVEPQSSGPLLAKYEAALREAAFIARSGETVTLLQVDGPDDKLTFKPLCVLTPPSASPPGGTHE